MFNHKLNISKIDLLSGNNGNSLQIFTSFVSRFVSIFVISGWPESPSKVHWFKEQIFEISPRAKRCKLYFMVTQFSNLILSSVLFASRFEWLGVVSNQDRYQWCIFEQIRFRSWLNKVVLSRLIIWWSLPPGQPLSWDLNYQSLWCCI